MKDIPFQLISDLLAKQKQAEELVDALKKTIAAYTDELLEDEDFANVGKIEGAGVRILLTKPTMKDAKYFYETKLKLKEKFRTDEAKLLQEEDDFVENGVVEFKSSARIQVKFID